MPVIDMGISDKQEDQLMILNVLSNTLYSDKVAAVLREYACNAADANVEAGKGDQPIEVRLPNKLDPTVSIRDFGYGMDEQQIANTFCRLGSSTKRNSNAFTGMLGIGSKAGFAYGDSFLVTSWTGGKMVVYNAFRDQGVPKLAKMHEGESNAPDGIEVKVPVRSEDMEEFIRKAERIFRYFKVRPIIHGAKITWDERAHEFAGTGWRYLGNGKSYAIMGNVGYDLSASAMGFKPTYSGYNSTTDPLETLLNLGVELDFNIGELEIAASREGLQYRDITKKAVTDRLKVVQTEISKVFTGKIASAPSWWEAKRLFHDRFENLGTYHAANLRDVVGSKVTWNGRKLDSGRFTLENKEKLPGISITKVTRRGTDYNNNLPKFSNDPAPSYVEAQNTVMFIQNDLPGGKQSPSRLRGALVANPNINTLIIMLFTETKSETAYKKNRSMDGIPITLMSAVTPVYTPMQQKAANVHNTKHSAKVFVLDETLVHDRYSSAAKSTWWKKEEVDIKKDSGTYVVVDRFWVQPPGPGSGQEEHPSDFLYKVKLLRKAGLLSGPMYAFKPGKADKLDAKRWKRLDVAMNDTLNFAITKANFSQELADSLAARAYSDMIDTKHRALFPVGSKMREHLDEVHRMRNPKASKDLLSLVYSGNAGPWLKKPTLPDPTTDLDDEEKKVLQLYPMCEMANLRDVDSVSMVKTISAYVKLIGQ